MSGLALLCMLCGLCMQCTVVACSRFIWAGGWVGGWVGPGVASCWVLVNCGCHPAEYGLGTRIDSAAHHNFAHTLLGQWCHKYSAFCFKQQVPPYLPCLPAVVPDARKEWAAGARKLLDSDDIRRQTRKGGGG